MIKPTVGRVVWFWPGGSLPHSQPLAAHVAAVWGDRCVNLMVIGHNGTPWSHPPTSVRLLQDDDEVPMQMDGKLAQHCAWMPYQAGQAAKAEAAEKKMGALASIAAIFCLLLGSTAFAQYRPATGGTVSGNGDVHYFGVFKQYHLRAPAAPQQTDPAVLAALAALQAQNAQLLQQLQNQQLLLMQQQRAPAATPAPAPVALAPAQPQIIYLPAAPGPPAYTPAAPGPPVYLAPAPGPPAYAPPAPAAPYYTPPPPGSAPIYAPPAPKARIVTHVLAQRRE